VVFYLLFDPWTILAVSTLKMLQDLTNSSSIGSVQRFLWDAGKVRLSDLKLHDIFEKASA